MLVELSEIGWELISLLLLFFNKPRNGEFHSPFLYRKSKNLEKYNDFNFVPTGKVIPARTGICNNIKDLQVPIPSKNGTRKMRELCLVITDITLRLGEYSRSVPVPLQC